MSDSETETKGKFDGKPRFNRDTRIQVSLAKFYGVDDEPWEVEKIAEYLNVHPSTIKDYVHNSELSEEVEEKMAEAQSRVRMRLAMKMLDRLDELEEMIDERKQVKEPEVVSHKNVTVDGDVVMQRDGMSVGGEDTETIEFKVPVPDHFKEVTEVSGELETLLREWRNTAQQVEDLLGLEAPEQIESEHREVSVEGRVFQGVDMGAFPDAEEELEGTNIELED